MAEPTFDETVGGMTTLSDKAFEAFAGTMAGVGAEAQAEWKTVRAATSAMVADGRSTADKMAKLRADTSLPHEHRYREATLMQDTTKALIGKYHQGVVGAAGRLEAHLMTGLLPKPGADSGQRMLLRDEIRNVIGNNRGSAMVKATIDHIGKNPAHDAELLSGFGQSLFAGHGVSDTFGGIKADAVQKYLARTDGTERQVNSRKALQAFRALNISGRVVAYRQSGLMHLGRDDR